MISYDNTVGASMVSTAPALPTSQAKIEAHFNQVLAKAQTSSSSQSSSNTSAFVPLSQVKSGNTTDWNALSNTSFQSAIGSTGSTSATSGVDDRADAGEYEYRLVEVGDIDRAPMAMFEHDGTLVMSAITRNEMDSTPVWTYTPGGTIEEASVLPEASESGNFGYSTGDVIHMTPESWSGMVDYTASSPDGPWTKHDYTDLNPLPYKNLKWGYSYMDPESGRQFMGFGNGDHQGLLLTYEEEEGDWKLFATEEDMLFPTGVGVINSGVNAGSVLTSSCTYGDTELHITTPDGETKKITSFDSWGFVKTDTADNLAYVALENGHVYWSDLDDLENWQECKYTKPSGEVDQIEALGPPEVHPTTGRMIFPTLNPDEGTNGFYEAERQGDEVVLNQVAWSSGGGVWTARMASVGEDLYFGTGRKTGDAEDVTPGVIYRLEAVPKDGYSTADNSNGQSAGNTTALGGKTSSSSSSTSSLGWSWDTRYSTPSTYQTAGYASTKVSTSTSTSYASSSSSSSSSQSSGGITRHYL